MLIVRARHHCHAGSHRLAAVQRVAGLGLLVPPSMGLGIAGIAIVGTVVITASVFQRLKRGRPAWLLPTAVSSFGLSTTGPAIERHSYAAMEAGPSAAAISRLRIAHAALSLRD